MCEILRDISIGIVSGVISSVIVTMFFLQKDKKIQDENGFKENVQTYHRYIFRIRNELEISYRLNDYSSLLRAIEEEPILSYFNNLSQDSLQKKKTISDFIQDLKQRYKDADNIKKETLPKDLSTLYSYSIIALEFKRNSKSNKWTFKKNCSH